MMPANHPFVKMNGIGNEILVVDLRKDGKPKPISEGEARAAATPEGGAHYDQLMALYPPKTPGTDFGPCASITMTAPKPAPAATACAASLRSSPGKTARKALTFETTSGVAQLLERSGWPLHRGHGQAAFWLEGHSARRRIPRHALYRVADRPRRSSLYFNERADPRVCSDATAVEIHERVYEDVVPKCDVVDQAMRSTVMRRVSHCKTPPGTALHGRVLLLEFQGRWEARALRGRVTPSPETLRACSQATRTPRRDGAGVGNGAPC